MNQANLRSAENLGDVVDKLRHIDWTFATARTTGGVHGFHPYPAKFVPQIPRTLLEHLHPIVGGPVLDPFCGSGTTLVECSALGIESVGIDLNPIATLVSRAKLNPPGFRLEPIARHLVSNCDPTAVVVPEIPRLDHWFRPEAALALASLRQGIDQLDIAPATRDAILVALSRIVVRVSRQESDTRYAAVDREVSTQDVFRLFVDSAAILDRAYDEEYSGPFRQATRSSIVTQNILTVTAKDLGRRFGLVITSPPYPNAYEYWLYHKYRMYWLGEDPVSVRQSEIGARPHYFKRNPATAADFEGQLIRCFGLFHEVTLPGAFVCFVVGRSIIRGEVINNAEIVGRAAAQNGFQPIVELKREIPATRKAFNPANSHIKEESICIFRKCTDS